MRKNDVVLITAYAVNPYKGSEDGTGWNMVCAIARRHPVIAVTRKNNRPAIEKYLAENQLAQASNLSFAYFDLPYWMRFWKKGGRGALLYFYLWQIGIIFFILRKKINFDIAHNLNFHTDWIPSFLWIFNKPFFWGPIGHHPAIPENYLRGDSASKTNRKEKAKIFIKKICWRFDPFLQICKRKADKIFVINSSVKAVLNLPEEKLVLLPAVAAPVPEFLPERKHSRYFNVLSVGRFIPLKGFDMTLRAFAVFYFKQVEKERKYLTLTLVGKGSELNSLKELAKALNIEASVQFIEWLPKAKLNEYFCNAAVFLFPSHEGAGMVVPEALSFGLPVGCYNNIGPGEFVDDSCGFRVLYSTYGKSINDFATYLHILFQEPEIRERLSHGATRQFEKYFTWERKGTIITNAYKEFVLQNEKKPVKV